MISPELENWLSSFEFQKMSATEYCRLDIKTKLTEVIDVQENSETRGSKREFTVNFGLYISGLMRRYVIPDYPEAVALENCAIWWRISQLSSVSYDKWWPNNNQESQNLDPQNEVIDLLEKSIEFSDIKFHCQADIAHFLEIGESDTIEKYFPFSDIQRKCYSYIIYMNNGECTSGKRVKEQLDLVGEDHPLYEVVQSVYRKTESW